MKYYKLTGIITEKNLTREEVADALGIKRAAFYTRLNGSPDFTVTEAFILQRLLGEPIEVMFKEAREDVKKADENDI